MADRGRSPGGEFAVAAKPAKARYSAGLRPRPRAESVGFLSDLFHKQLVLTNRFFGPLKLVPQRLDSFKANLNTVVAGHALLSQVRHR
jgi:hypothetical protein